MCNWYNKLVWSFIAQRYVMFDCGMTISENFSLATSQINKLMELKVPESDLH
jgi:hypothetical protein